MAKKKKSKGSGNLVLDALTEMLSVMSPEEKVQLMANLENIAQSGSPLDDMLEDTYTYQRPDYTKKVKPLANYLQTLLCAALPSDVLHAYEEAHNELVSLSNQELEEFLYAHSCRRIDAQFRTRGKRHRLAYDCWFPAGR